MKDVTNPYQVVFYDYRDTVSVKPENQKAAKVLSSVVLDIETPIQVKNEPLVFTHVEYGGYDIQVGANNHQNVTVDFPNTSINALGLDNYNIFPYGYCSVADDLRYDSEIMENADKLGKNYYRNYVGGTVKYTTVEVRKTQKVYDTSMKYVPEGYDKNGEVIPAKYVTEVTNERIETYTTTYDKREVIGGEVKEFYAYEPDSLERIDKAITSLNSDRAYLGAMTNRLEHAYLNDRNTAENLQSAESRIRDANMAEEMQTYSKNSILEQAAQSMLAQANQSTQGVLALLQ